MRVRATAFAVLFPLASVRAQVSVTGSVLDSVHHHPLTGALIQLVADSGTKVRTTTSDSLGAYRIDSVRAGSYIIGFFHPALDSLGLELTPKRVIVNDVDRHIDLAIPAAATLVGEVCRTTAPRDSIGLLLGHVRDADSQQPRTATVTVYWMELTIGQGGIQRNRQQIPVKTDAMGWFAMCGLPTDAEVEATAQAGDEESGAVSIRVPAGGLVIRDFLVSRADSTVTIYSQADTTSATPRLPVATLRRGTARVSGVVHNDKGKPVNNADVSVPGTGVDARTQQNGAFALAGLPAGTQTIEVRVIGFEPKRLVVDLSRDHLTTIDIALDRPVQTLDAVRVYGKGNATMVEFERRVKSGWGHILTPADIARRNAFRVTDLFRMMPGVRVAPMRNSAGYAVLLRGGCRPTVYVNGMRMDDNAATELDMLASPEEITGLEVYTPAGRPAEFWGNSCGSVVIWAGMLPR
jgi:Carboxypeptidase regulatory-like domain/TonB-dependent Receptor Plug Domain